MATQRIDDRKWTVTHSTSNNPFTERKYGIKVRTSGPPNNLRYRAYIHSNTEPEDVIADVIRPLMNSTDGFGSIHTAVFEAIVDKLYQERDQPECGKNAFIEANQEMEATSRACAKLQKAQWKLANAKDPERKDETTWQMAAAPLLAHYLTRADHPYDTIIAPIIREHRYGFEIPMRSIV